MRRAGDTSVLLSSSRPDPLLLLLLLDLERVQPARSVLLGRRTRRRRDPSPLPRLLAALVVDGRRRNKALVGLEVVGVDLVVGLLDRCGGGRVKVAVVLVVFRVRVAVAALCVRRGRGGGKEVSEAVGSSALKGGEAGDAQR